MANYNLGEARGKIILETDFKSLTEAQSALKSFEQNSTKNADNASAAYKKVGDTALVAGAVIAGGFALAVNAAGDFEFQMSAIQAVSGATADEMDLISEAALRIGKDTSYSSSEAAMAMEELIKAGISVEDVLGGAADATVALAAAGGVDLPTAATLASNAMNQFNLSAEDLVGVTDTIAGAANASAIDVGQFGMSLSQVGAVANLVGLSFDDTALAIAAMGNAGIVGSDAGTSLKSMLMRLNPSTKEASDLMSELGIITADGANQFYTAEGSLKSLSEVSDVLSGALAGMTDAQKQSTLETLFGADAIRGAAIIAETGSAGFDALSESINKVSAAEVAATRLDNMKGSMEALGGSIESVAITVGTAIIPVVTDMVDSLAEAVNWFSELDSGMQGAIVGSVGIAGGILLAVGTIIKITQAMQAWNETMKIIKASQLAIKAGEIASSVAMGVKTGVMAVATAAQWAYNAALLANPIGIVIALVVALVAALVWFFTQTELGQAIWTEFTRFLGEAWENIVDVATTVFGELGNFFGEVWANIQSVVQAVVGWFQTYVLPVITAVVNGIVAFFTGLWTTMTTIWNGIMTVISFVISMIIGYFNMWYTVVSTVIAAIIAVAMSVATFWMENVYPVIAAFIEMVVAIFNYLWLWVEFIWNAILLGVTTIVNMLVTAVTTAFQAISDFVSTIVQAVSDFISTVWGAIIGFVTPIFQAVYDFISTTFTNIYNFVKGIVDNVVNWITTQWNALVGIVTGVFKKIYDAVSGKFNEIYNFIKTIVDNVVSWISTQWNTIVGTVKTIFNNVKDAITEPIDKALEVIGGIKDKIVGFFTGAGTWLVDAGKKIIEGFINGLKSMLGGIADFFSGVTDNVPKQKGPADVDKVLLKPAGKMIMQGLMSGLQSEMGNLDKMLNGMNVSIPASLNQDILATVGTRVGDRDMSLPVAPIVINVEWKSSDDESTTKEQVIEMLGKAAELVFEERS